MDSKLGCDAGNTGDLGCPTGVVAGAAQGGGGVLEGLPIRHPVHLQKKTIAIMSVNLHESKEGQVAAKNSA